MNTWDDVKAESKSDAAHALVNEQCPQCGTVLGQHYDRLNRWVPCAK